MTAIPLDVLCATGAHCAACRAVGPDGDEFRRGLAAAYTLPETWPVCPYGRPMGYAGDAKPSESIGLGDTVHKWLERAGVTKLIGPCGGCAKRRAWMNRVFPRRRAKPGSPG